MCFSATASFSAGTFLLGLGQLCALISALASGSTRDRRKALARGA